MQVYTLYLSVSLCVCKPVCASDTLLSTGQWPFFSFLAVERLTDHPPVPEDSLERQTGYKEKSCLRKVASCLDELGCEQYILFLDLSWAKAGSLLHVMKDLAAI